jgi:4-hydroxy-4-methyl-2-oxoglutarate aldolase
MDASDQSAAFDSCDVSDACDRLGIEGIARTAALRPIWEGCPQLFGRIVTVRLEPGSESPLAGLLEVLAGAADSLVLVDLGGRVDVQCWGTVLATAARHFGVRGALVNGAVRDVDGLRALGFATYARGVYPARMRGRLRLAAVGEPVELDGAVVESGSFAVADRSGTIFLPFGRAEEVLALAAELRTGEQAQMDAISAGADPRSIFLRSDAADEQ